MPCVPIALNSGLFWPRRSFLRYPGTIRVEVLDPIAPGLDRKIFAARLQNALEAATARLVAEGEISNQGSGIGNSLILMPDHLMSWSRRAVRRADADRLSR